MWCRHAEIGVIRSSNKYAYIRGHSAVVVRDMVILMFKYELTLGYFLCLYTKLETGDSIQY